MILLAGLLAFVSLSNKSPEAKMVKGDGPVSPEPDAAVVASPISAMTTFKRVERQTPVSDSVYEPEKTDRGVLKKSMSLRYYHESAARDTPECRMIVELLAKEGIGLEAVPDFYNAAWDNKSRQCIIEQATAEQQDEAHLMVSMFQQQMEETLHDNYGIANQEVYDALFAMRPKVFFGQKNLELKPGDKLFQE